MAIHFKRGFCILLLLLTSGAIAHSQNPFFKHYSTFEGLPGSSVHALFADSKGTLWVGTNSGLAYLSSSKIKVPNQQSSLKNATVLSIKESQKGEIWVLTSTGDIYSGALDRIFTSINVSAKFKDEIENRIVNSFFPINNNEVYAATVIGGNAYKLSGNDVFTPFDETLKGFSFYARAVDGGFIHGSNGSFPPNNLFLFSDENGNSTVLQLSSKSGFTKSCFLQMKNGNFLFAKDYEIIQFNSEEVVQRSFLPKKIESIYETRDEKIWVGMNRGGAICFLTERMTTDLSSRYLSDQTVSSITESKNGNVWFGTLEEGMYLLPGEPEITYRTPQIVVSSKKAEDTQVKKSDNKSPEKLDTNAIVIQSPTPEIPLLRPDSAFPVVYISKVAINDEDTTVQSIYYLNHDENFIKLHFAGLINNQPKQLQYKYKLQGLDEDWHYSDVPYVQYSKLLPGEYAFSVYAMNNDGIWSKSPALMTFVVERPFWSSAQFYGLLIIVLLLFIVLALFYGLRRSRQKADKNKQTLMSELKVLRAQMNPHFTFNTLSSIQHFIGQNNNDAAIDYLSKFGKLLRSIMENTKKPTIPIGDEISALKLYLDLEKLRLNNKFEYEILIDKEVDIDYDEIPSLLIQPYVENAIWHGFSKIDGKGKVSIRVTKKDQYIICKIEDNGIGRDAARKMNGKRNGHKSMGMEITKERLEIINALKNSPLSVNIQDIKSENGKAEGTRVEIFIPFEED